MHFEATQRFEKDYRKLPSEIKNQFQKKLLLIVSNPNHPSLRHCKMAGCEDIFEFSVTMNYRATYQRVGDVAYLRRIGTHDILSRP